MTPRRNLILALALAALTYAAMNAFDVARHLVHWGGELVESRLEEAELGRLEQPAFSHLGSLAGVARVQASNEDRLFGIPGVVATGVGWTRSGRPALKVFVEPTATHPVLGSEIGGFPLIVERAGPFRALDPQEAAARDPQDAAARGPHARPLPPMPALEGDGPLPTSRFDRPVPMGVSTGHTLSTAGTIGAVVTDGRRRFALSNWHVFVPGGQGRAGDVLLQPGPHDGGVDPEDEIGTLSDFEPVVLSPFASNRIDAALAVTDQVVPHTPPDGYGSPRGRTMQAKPGLAVQKYGRTTRLTIGEIEAVNTTINVSYGSAGSRVARFTGQIMVCCNFSQGGDSGSLIVARDVNEDGESGADDRRPVGLLFAGDGRFTIANPIDPVLDRFGVTIVEDSDDR